MNRYTALFALGLAVGACRPDPGIPDYSAFDGITDGGEQEVEPLPGPFPYVPGEPRLFLGIHYEGGRSDAFLIDEETRRYLVFENSYDLRATDDRIEGTFADLLRYRDAPFWGGGLSWDTPTDLSEWTTMHISLKSEDPTFAEVVLEVQSSNGNGRVNATAYGYTNDGAWHSLVVPLSDFSGADFTMVTSPLVMSGQAGTDGDELIIDDFYYTQE